MASNDRNRTNESSNEPARENPSPDRVSQPGGNPGGYGPAQWRPQQGESDERSEGSIREREREH